MGAFEDIKLGVEQAIEYEKGNLDAREKTAKEIKCTFTEDQLKLLEMIASSRGLTPEDFVVETVMMHAQHNDSHSVIEQLRKEAAYRKDEAEDAMEELARTQVALQQANDKIKRLEVVIYSQISDETDDDYYYYSDTARDIVAGEYVGEVTWDLVFPILEKAHQWGDDDTIEKLYKHYPELLNKWECLKWSPSEAQAKLQQILSSLKKRG